METLREVRIRLNLNQSDIAGKIQKSIGEISNYELNNSFPDLEDMIFLENQLKAKIDWLEPLHSSARNKIIQDLNILVNSYPIVPVLKFVIKAIREGQKLGNPANIVSHYANISNTAIEPLFPAGVEPKK